METKGWDLHGYMVAVMAFMESPPSLWELTNDQLVQYWKKEYTIKKISTNALILQISVFLILGSLLIGYLADAKQAEGIKPLQMIFSKVSLQYFY